MLCMHVFVVIYVCILIVLFVAVISSFLFVHIAHIAARPEWMAHDPEIFYGFWGSCAVLGLDGVTEEQHTVWQLILVTSYIKLSQLCSYVSSVLFVLFCCSASHADDLRF